MTDLAEMSLEARCDYWRRRAQQLEEVLRTLTRFCPEGSDLRIMMISLSGSKIKACDLTYTQQYETALATACAALNECGA
jgi:hypothetical protein